MRLFDRETCKEVVGLERAKLEAKVLILLFTLLFQITREVGSGKDVLCVGTNVY